MLTDNQLALMRILEIRYANKPTLLLNAYNNARNCVLVVDMCESFCSQGAMASANIAGIIPSIATALDFLPDAEKVFVMDRHTEVSAEFKDFPPHCVTPRECAIVKSLARFAKNTVYKNSTNGLSALLNGLDIGAYDNFIIMGCCTDICVVQLATSLRAMLNERNLLGNVLTFTDYVATYDSPEHDNKLSSIFAFSLMETVGVKVFKKLG